MEYKAPTIPKDFTIEWSADLPTGVTIASCVWVPDAGLTEDSKSVSGTTSTIVISGGVAGTVYEVQATATGSDGEEYEQYFYLTVQKNIN